jgi:tetratricopeptide (TPR) repeat protein
LCCGTDLVRPLLLHRGNRAIAITVTLVIALSAYLLWPLDFAGRRTDSDSRKRLQQAYAAFDRDDFAAALDIAAAIPADDPLFARSRILAGEAATKLDRLDEAVGFYRQVPAEDSDYGPLSRFSLAEVYFHDGQLRSAAEAYAAAIELDAAAVMPYRRRALLMHATWQRFEAARCYAELVRHRAATVQELALFADLQRPLEVGDFLDRCATRHPEDPLVRLGLAVDAALVRCDPALARERLTAIVARDPTNLAALALLGEALLHAGDDRLEEWFARLPPHADDSADIWMVRGLRARRLDQPQAAARCFWEAVRREPGHRRAVYHLGQTLSAIESPAAPAFEARAGELHGLTHALDLVLASGGRNEVAVQESAKLLQQMGRIWEAWAWASMAEKMFPQSTWPSQMLAHLAPTLNTNTPLTLDSANLALRHDLSHLPLPTAAPRRATPTPGAAAQVATPVRFVDEATAAGLSFSYRNGDSDITRPGARMFEQTGGGVAVIDYDGDGLPDLYFTQGCRWADGDQQPAPPGDLTDRLFHNHGGRRFVDSTAAARLVDSGFGQGAAVGDFNSDGFPDLYVANIGPNQLLLNNGDGTFQDATSTAGLQHGDWTSSCLIADLNHDGHPDLFDVTYLEGDDVFTRLCQGLACSPRNFRGTPDRLLLNRGDGALEELRDSTPSIDSKGLGVVALDVDGRGRLSLFISNDQVPNFLLRNDPLAGWPGIELRNESFATGLAFNEDGLAMAGMGIAAGDADGDGRVDLYVANFRDESNTLYLQDAPGLFIDATRGAGLREPSLPYVGWGTQFLDAELDGDSDLVLVNGDVDDYRPTGGMSAMPAQFLQNQGGGRFVELKVDRAGSFFKPLYQGRGLARVDWNADGRMDFVVSNVNSPAALATNRTEPVGRFFNLRVKATDSARDAFGTHVTVVCDDCEWRQQLVAGDGFMASNERVLQFGLGSADAVDTVVIHWPSGGTTTLHDLPVDATLDVIEACHRGTLTRGGRKEGLDIP